MRGSGPRGRGSEGPRLRWSESQTAHLRTFAPSNRPLAPSPLRPFAPLCPPRCIECLRAAAEIRAAIDLSVGAGRRRHREARRDRTAARLSAEAVFAQPGLQGDRPRPRSAEGLIRLCAHSNYPGAELDPATHVLFRLVSAWMTGSSPGLDRRSNSRRNATGGAVIAVVGDFGLTLPHRATIYCVPIRSELYRLCMQRSVSGPR